MAFILKFPRWGWWVRLFLAATLSAIVGVQLGAFSVVLQTLFSGVTDLPFDTFVLLMQPIHLAIGIVEGLATSAVVIFVRKARPEIVGGVSPSKLVARPSMRKVMIGLLAAAMVTGGVLSWFASSNPDGLEWSMFKTAGTDELDTPQKGVHAALADIQEKTALLPDYGFKAKKTEQPAGAPKSVSEVNTGKTVSGLVGGSLTLLAVMIGIFNPLMDRDILVSLGGIGISGGWVSFMSILMRFVLTVGIALTLIAVTGFNAVCIALDKLGTPRVFVVQLVFLYRYMFVLLDEAARMVRARSLRTFEGGGSGIKAYGPLLGQLLLRTMDRAQRVYLAMCCRGFDGEIRILKRLRFGPMEIGFTVGWSALFFLMRVYNVPAAMGSVIMGFLK